MMIPTTRFRPLVSVIVPVRNEGAHIRRTLDCISQQYFPANDLEILVVDGCSEDDTVQVVREYQQDHDNVFLFFNPKRLSSAARNVAIQQSRGRYLIVVDGHCEIQNPYYLADLVEAFETTDADTLGRPQPLCAGTLTPFQQAVSAARMSWLGHNPDSSIFDDQARFVDADNVAVAYHREVFEQIGLFDESFDACEDVDFNTRARQSGMTCFFEPRLSVDYQPRRSAAALAYQMMRYGQGRARLARKNPKSITIPSLAPPLALLGLIIGSIASVASVTLALLMLAATVGYLLIVSAESLRLIAKSMLTRHDENGRQGISLGAMCSIPFVFPAIHFGFAWGYLREIAWGRELLPVPIMASQTETLTPSDLQTNPTPSIAA